MSASSVLPGLDMMPANLWVDAALAMVQVELYRNFGEKPFIAKGRKEIPQGAQRNSNPGSSDERSSSESAT
jgi:hypothetical protein